MINREIAALVIGAALFVGAPLLAVWRLTATDSLDLPQAAGIVGSVGTLLLVGVGGLVAMYRFRLFRHHEPHLTVDQEVTHHRVSPSYVAIVVTVRLANTSRVAVRVRDSLHRIQRLDGFDDDDLNNLYARSLETTSRGNLPWPTLDEFVRHWQPGDLTVEPGETHSETHQFLVGADVRTVLVYSLYYNPKGVLAPKSDRRAWHTTTVFSLATLDKG